MDDTPTEQSVGKPSSPRLVSLSIIAGSLIVGVSIAGATYLYTKALKVKEPKDLSEIEKSYIWEPYTPTSTDPKTIDEEPINTEIEIEKYPIEVSWHKDPIKVSNFPFKLEEYYTDAYEVGTILNGAFAEQKVYMLTVQEMGSYTSLYTTHGETVVPILDWIPEIDSLPSYLETSGGARFIRDRAPFASFFDLIDMARARESKIGTLKLSELLSIIDGVLYSFEECFFAKTPGGLIIEYVLDIPFIYNESENGYRTPVISFTRNDGRYISSEYEVYDFVSYGCGSLCSPLKVVHRPDSDFSKVGEAEDGTDLFVLKNPYDAEMSELYYQPNTRAYVDTKDGQYVPLEKNKYSYEQFLDMVPILYWKDTLGRWVKFIHSQFLVLAEKCKPIIYLYPKERTDLHVEVTPNLGFTETIPEYKSGWDVTAFPDGTIIEKSTNKEYEYLYWSGYVEGYPLIERGWVVRQKDLEDFFEHYLPLYGLNQKEIKDFKEYWKGEFEETPYYAISFVDQAIIEELSPLSIDVRPDTVIRVLFSAMPLQRPIPLKSPVIPDKPVRHGFTVVEWGGVILRAL